MKLILARYAVKRWKSQLAPQPLSESPLLEKNDGWDSITLRASAPNGSAVLLNIRKICINRKSIAQVTVFVKLADGKNYKLPRKLLLLTKVKFNLIFICRL